MLSLVPKSIQLGKKIYNSFKEITHVAEYHDGIIKMGHGDETYSDFTPGLTRRRGVWHVENMYWETKVGVYWACKNASE